MKAGMPRLFSTSQWTCPTEPKVGTCWYVPYLARTVDACDALLIAFSTFQIRVAVFIFSAICNRWTYLRTKFAHYPCMQWCHRCLCDCLPVAVSPSPPPAARNARRGKQVAVQRLPGEGLRDEDPGISTATDRGDGAPQALPLRSGKRSSESYIVACFVSVDIMHLSSRQLHGHKNVSSKRFLCFILTGHKATSQAEYAGLFSRTTGCSGYFRTGFLCILCASRGSAALRHGARWALSLPAAYGGGGMAGLQRRIGVGPQCRRCSANVRQPRH